MRPQVAAVTMLAFLMALLWPYASRADAPAKPQPAVSDDALNQAKLHFEAGKNAYNAGDYISSIREFKAAEALRPSPILAYNIGLANEKLGKKRVALKYFHRYLDQMPTAQNRAEVEGRIAQLDAEVAAQPPPPLPPPGQPAPGAVGATVEQPGDMPPPQESAPPAAYDPYGSTAPHNAAAPAPAKKKSNWWVWLIVAGGATLVIAVVVALVVVYGDTSNSVFTAADRAMLTNARDPNSSSGRTSSTLLPLIHF